MREEALSIVGFLRIMCYAVALKTKQRSTSPPPNHHQHHSPAYNSGEFFFQFRFQDKKQQPRQSIIFLLLRTVLLFIDFIWNILTAEIPNHNKIYSRSQGNVGPFIYKYLNFSRRNAAFIWSRNIPI